VNLVLIGRYDDPHVRLVEESLSGIGGKLLGKLELGRAAQDYEASWNKGGFAIATAASRIDDSVISEADLVLCLPFAVNNPDLVAASQDLADASAIAFAAREWNEFMKSALLHWEDHASLWITSFNALTLQGRKLYLLQRAIEAGLRVPLSIVGNVLTQAHLGNLNRPIAKPINRWQEIAPSRYFNATPLTREHIAQIADVHLAAPSFIQEGVFPNREHRIYVVGRKCIEVAIQRLEDGPVDVRIARVGSVVASLTHDLGPIWLEALGNFTRSVGLAYCVFDVLTDQEGQAWLIDINPVGTWAYLVSHGLDITNDILHSIDLEVDR
jgi:hypothetical protein